MNLKLRHFKCINLKSKSKFPSATLRIRLVGWVEKKEDIKYFNFPPFCLVGNEKVQGWKK